ncbi:MAG TPA: sulfatase-like hydrolase/transferase [Kofleriaceae bacterium]|nr:sulfatase-like hydrolase/transferase [Kofleriaceae bacterium]
MLLYRSLRDGVTADVGRAIAMATGGALAFAPIEYALTVWAYAGSPSAGSLVRLFALTTTLALVLWLVLAVALAVVAIGVRLIRSRIDPTRARALSLWDLRHRPLVDDIRPAVPRVWATLATSLVLVVALQRAALWALTHYKEPQLTAILIGAAGLAIAVASLVLYRALVVAATVAAGAFTWLGAANPLGRWRAAGVALAGLVGGLLAVAWFAIPQSRSYLPIRLVASAVVIALGAGLGLWRERPRPQRRPRNVALAVAGVALALMVATLVKLGGDPETKYFAITASPALDRLIGLVRFANDLDRDGYGSLLGEADCAPLDPKIHPGDAVDIPDDGIDQNCDGRDFTLASLTAPTGPKLPVPDAFKRDWNILFITIDTVRYDHTTFGGYADGPKKRDTTPRLAQLVKKSTSFAYAQAPSAGTMASIPAILTSRFFHSGIALDEKRPPGSPPGILPENTTLPEIMRRKSYKTGIIGSHEWWTGWGFEQGVDPEDYDNSIGKVVDPRRVVADKVTDHALAWISRQQGKKWFLWAHYIDPHGYYVAHPDVVDYGSSDPDLYDAEIKWTDQEVGRLLDELVRLPSYANTIIIITSDHGESMGEHAAVPLGTHGTALYRELTHVPLIFFIPDNQPRVVHGAVTNLDVVPTIADLCGIDVSDLPLEGKSLVPELFYGKENRDRIVFAETNAPGKQRAAISERWRLIYYLATNVYELFDTQHDWLEKTNLAPANPPELAVMKRALDQWLERVLYARDPLFNQAFRQMSDVILKTAVTPPVATANQSIVEGDGAIEILGIGPADGKPLVPGRKADVHIYFRVKQPIATGYRFSIALWQAAPGTPLDGPTPSAIVRGPVRTTAEGAYPPNRWKRGELIRERFPFNIPADWRGGIAVGLYVVDPATGERRPPAGPHPSNEPNLFALGILPLAAPASPQGSQTPPRP